MKLKIIQDTDHPTVIDEKKILRKSWSTVYPTTIIDEEGNEVHVQATKLIEDRYYIGGKKQNGVDITVDEEGRVLISYLGDLMERIEWSPEAVSLAKDSIKENTFHTDRPLVMGKISKFGIDSVEIEWSCKELFDITPLIVDGEMIEERCTIIKAADFILQQDGLKEYVYFAFPNGDGLGLSRKMVSDYLDK